MTINRHRALKLSVRRGAPLAAALAVALLAWSGAQAAAAPTLSQTDAIDAPPGVLIGVSAAEPPFGLFDGAGTNPRFTEAVFSTLAYYDASQTGVSPSNGRLFVQVKSAAELSALASPPDSPFTVTAEVTMTNDEGETGTGTITFETHFTSDGAEPTPAPRGGPRVEPTLSRTDATDAPPGVLISVGAGAFADAGTNPRITNAVFSTTAYLNTNQIHRGRLFLEVKTADELNALASPPDSPFTFTAEVTMTNDEGLTGTGTITFSTSYDRDQTPKPAAVPVQPTLSRTAQISAPPGELVTIGADEVFDNAGTNPRFTNAVFSATAYYDVSRIEAGRLAVQAKTARDLNTMASPPDSPFTVTVEVTMSNDEGETATGTLSFETHFPDSGMRHRPPGNSGNQ